MISECFLYWSINMKSPNPKPTMASQAFSNVTINVQIPDYLPYAALLAA